MKDLDIRAKQAAEEQEAFSKEVEEVFVDMRETFLARTHSGYNSLTPTTGHFRLGLWSVMSIIWQKFIRAEGCLYSGLDAEDCFRDMAVYAIFGFIMERRRQRKPKSEVAILREMGSDHEFPVKAYRG